MIAPLRQQQAHQANSVIHILRSTGIAQLMRSITEYELPLGKKLAWQNLQVVFDGHRH